MKKSNLLFGRLPFHKLGFLSFLLTFLFFAGMTTDLSAQQKTNGSTNASVSGAQTSQKMLFAVPTGNFVNVSTAQERLLNALTALKGQLAQYAEGTAPYDAAFLRYTYYNEILANLNNGRGVAESISIALGRIVTKLDQPATPEQALAEKNAAISLLRP